MLYFSTNINGRLITAVIAVTLSLSFLSDPSIPVRVRDLKELEKPFQNGGYSNEDQLDQVMTEFFLPTSETDGWHTFAHYIGLVCAWPVAERFGRKRGILYSNFFRFLGVMFHFGAIYYGTYFPATEEDGYDTSLYPSDATNSTNLKTESSSSSSSSSFDSKTLINFSLSSKLADGFHSGLSTVLGILYVYEISPKSSKIGALPVMAFFMFLKSAAEYLVLIWLPPLLYSPINREVWITSGILSLVAGLLQLALVFKYCPEPPSFLALQKSNVEEAKKVLKELRGEEQVNEELEEIEKDEGQREALKRSMFLVSLYLLYSLYNGVFLLMGFLHGLELGISLTTCVNSYLCLDTAALLIPLICFNNMSLGKIKSVLFFYYWLLGMLYFITSCIATINLQISPSLFQSNPVAAALVVGIAVLTALVFSSGPGIITIILINEYTTQAERSKNFILSWIFGIIVTSKAIAFFAVIFIKALLAFYLFQVLPWLFLGVITWFVWTFETEGYGANREQVDDNANFQPNPNLDKNDSENSVNMF